MRSIPLAAVWADLSQLMGRTVPTEVRTRNGADTFLELNVCNTCSVQWFEPFVAGDDAFYEYVAPKYPAGLRWEMVHLLRRITPDWKLVDLGCGDGLFLDAVRRQGISAIGVDSSSTALHLARSRGLEVYQTLSEAVAAGTRPSHIAMLQVLEHLDDFHLLDIAREALRADGTLFVSVPNPDRLERSSFEVLDHPPHHLTRWTAKALKTVGALHGFKLLHVRREPLPPRRLVRAWLRRRPSTDLGGHEVSEVRIPRWKKSYWRLLESAPASLPLWGHSMLAEFQVR